MKRIILDGFSLTPELLSDAASDPTVRVTLSAASKKRMQKSRMLVEKWIADGETIYGVTTGFGELSTVRINPADAARLQENLIMSHAAGAGEPLPPPVVRGIMALRVNALAKGFSGIRVETVESLLGMLNADIVPIIPSKGSVGSSGDLVQLSHVVLCLIGKGDVWYRGKRMTAKRALRAAGLAPVRLTAKEGLALINGTQMMTSFTALAVCRAKRLAVTADCAGALSTEALRGSDTAFDKRIHKLRPHKGQSVSAAILRRMMKGSALRESHRIGDSRVQDAYSIRCIPQVHGASRDAIEYAYSVVSTEINSATDNPLIFPEGEAHLEGGNFHGQPIALVADFLAIALAELASISERRIERMVNGSLSGLPKFLTAEGGLNSGLMIAQYTAASLVSENKVLCHPGSVDSIPTSANQEDHNSMGSISAQKLWRVLHNAETVLGIELLCASQALDFARHAQTDIPLPAGKGTEAVYKSVRNVIPHLYADRVLQHDIERATDLVRAGAIIAAAERIIGALDIQ